MNAKEIKSLLHQFGTAYTLLSEALGGNFNQETPAGEPAMDVVNRMLVEWTTKFQAKSKEEGWISVKDGLPNQRCLLLTTSSVIVIGDFYKGIWRIDGATRWVSRESGNNRVVNRYRELVSDYNKEDITHWKRLPSAAFGKEGEG